MRQTFRGAFAAMMAAGMILASCGAGSEIAEPEPEPASTAAPAESTTTSAATDTSPTTIPASDCGQEFPVFYPLIEPVAGEDKGDGVRVWREDEFGLVIEARWPASTPEDPVDGGGSVVDRRVIDNGSVLIIDVGGEPGCNLMEVTLTADRIEPLVDYELSFIEDIRPVSELEAFLNPEEPELPDQPAGPAYLMVSEFLEAAGNAEWEFASSLLFNEGIYEAVEETLGLTFENWDEAPSRLAEYCSTALCSAPYELTGIERDGPWIASVVVTFDTDDGPAEWRARVGQFEGVLSLGSLPPVGAATDRPTLSERLFGDEETFSATWYDAVQFVNPTGSQWSQWWRARFGPNQVLNRWGISAYAGGIAVDDLVGEFEPEFLEFDEIPYLGSGVFGGREVVFLGADNILLELDVASLEVEPKLEASDPEAFVGPATAAGNTVAMSTGVGDSLWIEFYGTDLELISSTRDIGGVYAHVDLDPTGTTAAVAIESEINVINQVGLVDVATGGELESWGFAAELGNITEIAYNGRFIFAPIEPAGDEPPLAFVVDTRTGLSSFAPGVPAIRF